MFASLGAVRSRLRNSLFKDKAEALASLQLGGSHLQFTTQGRIGHALK